MDEYLSIKDFAARAGVSPQAVYKRLNNQNDELNNWLKVVDGKKTLAVQALSIFQDQDDSTSCATSCQPVVQPVDNEIRNEYIEFLKAELDKKNEQIDNLQKLLSQEQQLRLVADQRILMLEAKKEESEPEEIQENEPIEEPRKWWQFWK